jgi:hypothetical protein
METAEFNAKAQSRQDAKCRKVFIAPSRLCVKEQRAEAVLGVPLI